MTTHTLPLAKLLLFFLGCAALLFGFAFHTNAQTVTMILTVNGGSSAQIVNGQSVTLAWYIDGPVTSCSINNGVGNIDVTSLPASGSMVYTPPANSNTNFVLNCDGSTSSVTVAIAPTVTMTLPRGNPATINPLTGTIDRVDVNWDAPLATRCGNIWTVSATRGTYTANNSSGYTNQYQSNGRLKFDGWPHGNIYEDTTFYIVCYNDVTGASATGSISLSVLNPAGPPPPVLNLWTNTPVVNRSVMYGYAIADVRFDSFNTTWCNYSAYYPDGTPYASLPRGYGAWGGNMSGNFTNIQISSSTLFSMTCSRSAVTIGGTLYPATSTSASVFVDVLQGATSTDRTTLPPVTIAATATPSTVVRDPITGRGTTTVDLAVANADYCYLRAFRLDNGSEYNLANWTRTASWDRLGGNNSYSFYLWDITIDTRLNIQCLRQYDVDNYNPTDPEYANGYETLDVIITATSSPIAALPPESLVYGNGWFPDANHMNLYESLSNYSYNSSGWLEGPSAPALSSVTLTFDHPYDSTDVYDIYLRYCDETDGVDNTFSVSVNGGPSLGTIVTDDPRSGSNICDNDSTFVKRIAAGVTLSEGDAVTVSCQNAQPAPGEFCRLKQVYFGAGAGDGSVLSGVKDSTTGFADVPIFWYSYYTTRCSQSNSLAIPLGNPALQYQWKQGNRAVYGTITRPISTSTKFTSYCYRDGDSLTDTGSVTIDLPYSFTLTASTSVASGQCKDPVTLLSITAPPGYMADPTTGLCVVAVDLAAYSPSPGSGATADNVYGTYDNFDALIAIENLGPGALPQFSGVTYLATIDPHPAHGLPQMVSPTGYFNATITAPTVMPGSTLSPTLTRTFDGVPFGTHQLCSRVNLDGSPNFPEHNPDTTNNTSCSSITLPVPPPPMTLTADRIIVRPEQTVDLTWYINVAYEMNCSVNGPGGINSSFNTLTTGHPYSVTQTTGPLTSTSEFVFTCNEPITNTTFTEEVTVEVVPESQEI